MKKTLSPELGTQREAGARTVALIGPYLSGKTSLLESMLTVTDAIARKGSAAQGHMTGDTSNEARAHHMGVELNIATTQNHGEALTLLDCPGSIEFLQDTLGVLPGVDAALVVCEPDASKVLQLQPYLKRLSDAHIPTILFVNKIDQASGSLDAFLNALQSVSERPLLARQLPIWEKGQVTGFVDLVLERAHAYRPHDASKVIPLSGKIADEERAARFHMLEQLADFDDHLMEELLDDVVPPQEEVTGDMAREVGEGHLVPVLFGSAENDNGIRRLLKALRHDVPGPMATLRRLGVEADGEPVVRILKTMHTAHGGKLSLARVLRGTVRDGMTLADREGTTSRIGGVFRMMGTQANKNGEGHPGECVALGRLDEFATGDVLIAGRGAVPALEPLVRLSPVYFYAVSVADRHDDVKLSAALARLAEEDPSLVVEHRAVSGELVLEGQGEIHLRIAAERLAHRYGLAIEMKATKVPYREAIRKGVEQRARYKRQTGGHGQFADVTIEIEPLARGTGFAFDTRITGGVVPKQYFSAVEAGVCDALEKGPLGFPVVDVKVTLTDGATHSVDSSENAFRAAGRLAMSEAFGKCGSVLLEPIMAVTIEVPSEATPRVNAIVSGRRGQILGFDLLDGWQGWDVIRTQIPESELKGLIVDLRSASQGVARFEATFDHLSELAGRIAEDAIARGQAA